MVALQLLFVAGLLGAEPEAVLLNFTQAECSHCRAMEPVLAELEAGGLNVQSIDVAQHPEVAQRFKLEGTPTYVMLVNGRETGRAVGISSTNQLQELFPRSASANNVRGQSPEEEYPLRQIPDIQYDGSSRPAGGPPAGDPFNRQPVESSDSSAGRVVGASYEETIDSESVESVDPRARAMAATVRLRVEEPQGHAIGTGTIIDTQGDEAVLITCAHIFRASNGKGRIQVELFHPQPRTIEGKLLEYDLDRDIALVSIVPGTGTMSVPVSPTGAAINKGDAAFSVGCDKGADPTLRQTKINSLDRYVGFPNIEAAGEPTVGRSGGGLFSADGHLIGVCNCADEQDNEGIYAAIGTIHWQLEKVGLAELYKPQSNPAVTRAAPNRLAETRPLALRMQQDITPEVQPAVHFDDGDGDTEMVVIVRSRSNPSAKGQIVLIPRASQRLLQQIAADSADPIAAADLKLTADRRNALSPARENGPIVRGQSRH